MTHKKDNKPINLIIVGDSSVGKTNILQSFIGNYNNTKKDLVSKKITIEDKQIIVRITDYSRKDKISSTINSNSFRNADGVLIVYDVTSRESFIKTEAWIKAVINNCRDNIHRVLVGNKADLSEKNVLNEEGYLYAELNQMKFSEISANDKANVDNMILSLCNDIVNDKKVLFFMIIIKFIEVFWRIFFKLHKNKIMNYKYGHV